MSCISNTELFAAQAALAVAVLKDPVHRALAAAGLVAPPDLVGRDVRTVAFLRSLDLDPVAILGPEIVGAAEAWRPVPGPAPWRHRGPRLVLAAG